MEKMIEFSNASIGYRDDPVPVMSGLNLYFEQGDQVAVIGPNGAGKSTLFKSIVGLIPPLKGKIFVHGRDNGRHKDCVSYIPQREQIDWNFPVTVYDVVMMGRYGKLPFWKRPSKEDREIVWDAMEQMEISSLAKRKIKDCSGGQQQRVFLARTIAQQPHVLLMDEPFNGVDAPTRMIILEKLQSFQKEGITVIASTHDFDIVSGFFQKTLLLDQEVVAFGETETVLTEENLRRAFGGKVVITHG